MCAYINIRPKKVKQKAKAWKDGKVSNNMSKKVKR